MRPMGRDQSLLSGPLSMTGRCSAFLFAAAVTFLAAPAFAQAPAASSFVHANGPQLMTPDGHSLLLKGINLGNWLEPEGYMFLFEHGPQSTTEIEALIEELAGPDAAARFWKEWRENYITREDIDFIRRAGMNSVRIPLHYKFFLNSDEGFPLLDRVIAWCREAHIWVVLDLHCAPGGQTGTNIDDSGGYPWLFRSPEAQRQTIAVWKRLAEHYRNEPAVLGYDLLNEPIPHFPALQPLKSELEPLYRRISSAIREVDPNHVVILGGARWDTDFSVFSTPFDKNVMYTFHKYWMTPDQASVQEYVDFRARYNVPVWLGESGENTDDWVRQFAALLEKNNIGWCFWPYKKMERSSAPVSIVKPAHWDEIVAFAKMDRGTGNAEKRIAARPSAQNVDQALGELLQNIRLAKCQVHGGYLKALGMRVP
jgi:endoglucanase